MDRVGVRLALFCASLALAAVGIAGCGKDGPVSPHPVDPQHIAVLYLLVGFDGSVPGQTIARSKASAESLALSLVVRAKGGEDFGDLVDAWSDSPQRDTVRLANYGVPPATGEYTRASLVRNFGDVSFSLAPDSIGLAVHDPTNCPFGWYVILRVE